MRSKILLLTATLGAAFVFHGCGGGTTSEGSGTANIAALTADDVDAIQITVTGPAISTPIVANLSKDPGTGVWSGVMPDIPIGNNTFLAEAFEAGVLVYSGSVTTDVLEAQQISVTIFLQQVTPPDPFANTVPTFQSLVISPSDPAPNEDVTLTVVATDPDVGDSIALLWSSPVGSFDATDQATVVWTAPAAEGAHPVTVSATDNSGAAATLTASITVQTPTGGASIDVDLNTWPVATNLVPDPTRIDVGETTQLDLTAADPDGDLLTYSWSANCPGSYNDALTEDPTFTLNAIEGNNTCELRVVIDDGRGGNTNAAVTIDLGPAPQPSGPPPAVPCPCWDGGAYPVSLAAYWADATSCSSLDSCQNTSSPTQTQSRAICSSIGPPEYESRATDSNGTLSCGIRRDINLFSGITNLSPEQYATCLAEHEAFTQNQNSPTCGLPSP